ncbi:MAG: glutamate racemase [Bacteroidetes bacterium]|nr:glutamate racemase [Bacteroidota bacterium]
MTNLNAVDNAIGVFDSGIGGLSVLKQLIRFLPFEKYIYLGDTGRVPYGNKSNNTLQQYALECTKFLIEKNVKLIVVACNTVSAVALETVKTIAKDIPVIGMIQPAAKAALHSTKNNKIGIIGTRATITSNKYLDTIKHLTTSKSVNVFSQACPLFVPLVEEGMIDNPAARLIVKEYLQKLIDANIDTLILGCTHYPLLSHLFLELMPNVIQIDTGEQAAVTALRLLAEQNLLQPERQEYSIKYNIKFYVTDIPNQFYELAQRFLGFAVDTPEFISL